MALNHFQLTSINSLLIYMLFLSFRACEEKITKKWKTLQMLLLIIPLEIRQFVGWHLNLLLYK